MNNAAVVPFCIGFRTLFNSMDNSSQSSKVNYTDLLGTDDEHIQSLRRGCSNAELQRTSDSEGTRYDSSLENHSGNQG